MCRHQRYARLIVGRILAVIVLAALAVMIACLAPSLAP